MNEHDKRINSVKSSPANIKSSMFPKLYRYYIPLISPLYPHVHAFSDHDHTELHPTQIAGASHRCHQDGQFRVALPMIVDPRYPLRPHDYYTTEAMEDSWDMDPCTFWGTHITMENHNF